jgi:hypothetical protein
MRIMKMEAIHSSETSVHTRCTRRHIPEDGNLYTNICLIRIVITISIEDRLLSEKYFSFVFHMEDAVQIGNLSDEIEERGFLNTHSAGDFVQAKE